MLVVAAVSPLKSLTATTGAASKMLLACGVCRGADVSAGGVGISCCSCGGAPKGNDDCGSALNALLLLVVAAVSLIADAAGAASKMLLVWGVCGGADVSAGGVGISCCCCCGGAPKGYD